MIECLCYKNKKIFLKVFKKLLKIGIFMLKAFQKVILIFKLELKYILKLIAYTNKKCNVKSWKKFLKQCIKKHETVNTVSKSDFRFFC